MLLTEDNFDIKWMEQDHKGNLINLDSTMGRNSVAHMYNVIGTSSYHFHMVSNRGFASSLHAASLMKVLGTFGYFSMFLFVEDFEIVGYKGIAH